MTQKEKAKHLIDKMISTIGSDCEHDSYCSRDECKYEGRVICVVNQKIATQCALIAVKELIDSEKGSDTDYVSGVGYWQLVKKEIEKL